MSKITIMQMSTTPDDVFITPLKSVRDFSGDLRALYSTVKDMAISFARNEDLHARNDKSKTLVEMRRNEEGLPTACVYQDGTITNKFFGTYQENSNEV